jgi:hypothetical protein
MATKKTTPKTAAAPTSITATYGNGDPKKHSVRMNPTATDTPGVKLDIFSDIYIPRAILEKLGVEEDGEITITFAAVQG